MKITKEQARRFLLAHHNLRLPRRLEGKEGILSFIRRVGCIQFDPLNMVGYNTELVLQSRVRDFKPEMLQELLYEERKLVDGFDKNMAIYPVEDWPYFSRYREKAYARWGREPQLQEILPEVRTVIAEQGPVSSGDLQFDTKVRWPWGPTRASRAILESMYFWGELVIHHKAGTRKYYDFAAKYLPEELLAAPEPNPTEEEYHRWNVRRRIGAVGLLWNRPSDAWLGIENLKSKERAHAFAFLEEQGEILPVEVEGIKSLLYLRTADVPVLEEVLADTQLVQPEAALLAPLDNLLWDRKLIKELFDFEYTWEVYKPAAERQYGYYVLPVLYGDRFVARLEPRLDKKTRVLTVLNWWWEPGVEQTEEMTAAVQQCLLEFQRYLGAQELRMEGEWGL